MAEGAGFCPKCGQGQGGPAPGAPASAASGLEENVAATLSYALGWITGLIFFFTDKRPYVRFHAAQSIVVFGGLHIVLIVLGSFWGFSMFMGGWGAFSFGFLILRIVDLLAFVLWILCMIKAYQGERFKVPIAAGIAEGLAGK
jgi:uncharacterized membrane protein